MTKRYWDALKQYHKVYEGRHILSLFKADSQRAENFSLYADDMLLDYAKTNIDAEGRALLLELARATKLAERRAAMFSGVKINETENRAVLHMALRNHNAHVEVDGCDVMPDLRQTYAQMCDFAHEIRRGPIKDVINIGIGGSDLGPAMACLALLPYADGPRCHFISNVDGAHAADVLRGLDPKTTLVIVASKTFTTIETMINAATVRRWMVAGGGNPETQFAAVSTALDKAADLGIPAARVFGFGDWVGGRYSLWGPIGLPVMLSIGPDHFANFLQGGAAMDHHFQTAEDAENMPVMLALCGIWHNQICGYATRAVLPYDQRLSRFPAYLQQLEMESNGKSVAMDGSSLPYHSGPIVWGEPGTNGQHAFYQFLHQGTRVVPCEFLVARRGHETDLVHQHLLLVANCLAQSEALLRGRSLNEARQKVAEKGFHGDALECQARHRVFEGNRPSITLAYDKLTPFTLGQIIALYEHRVFVEGIVLGINSYDQWGVELGKELALALQPVLEGVVEKGMEIDGSTSSLIDWFAEKGKT